MFLKLTDLLFEFGVHYLWAPHVYKRTAGSIIFIWERERERETQATRLAFFFLVSLKHYPNWLWPSFLTIGWQCMAMQEWASKLRWCEPYMIESQLRDGKFFFHQISKTCLFTGLAPSIKVSIICRLSNPSANQCFIDSTVYILVSGYAQ